MGDVVVVGAGIGGLATALLLGRKGRRVIVCERDAAPLPGSTEEMWSAWPRPGTPHAPIGHGFTPGFRALLRERAPDVLQRLWDAGAQPHDNSGNMPGEERRPEDAELTGIMCRRAVLEGVLRRVVEAEPTVELRAGCHVAGLLAEPSPLDGVPRVIGVRMKDDGAIAAESVVVAGGRSLPIGRWLEAIGARPPAELSEGCGFVWCTRYFRVLPRDGEDYTVASRLATVSDLNFLKYAFWGADAGTFCAEFGVPIWDHELRRLRDEAAFMAAARAMPEGPTWLDPDRSAPIGPVAVFGQEHNVLRNFPHDGSPLALDLHVIGDARCRTNSDYAWGAGMAFAQAATLADVLAEHRGDAVTQALAFETRMGAEIAGRHDLSVTLDRATLRAYHGQPKWREGDGVEAFIQTVVVPAASEDAEVFRAFRRRGAQLDPVGALAQNTRINERARELAAARQPSPPTPPAGPTRQELLEIIAAAQPGEVARRPPVAATSGAAAGR